MDQSHLNKAVENISNLGNVNASDLKTLVERYPFCQIAQVLYTKKLYEEGSSSFQRQLHKTSGMVFDRNVLFHLIEKTPVGEIVNAGFDEEIRVNENQLVEQKQPENKTDEISEPPLIIHDEMSVEALNEMVNASEIETEEIHTIEEIEIPENEFKTEIDQVEMDVNEDIAMDEITSEMILEETETEELIIEEEVRDLPEETVELDQTQVVDLGNLDKEDFKTDDITKEQLPYSIPEKEFKIEIENIEQEEPIFELPAYNIEAELGKLSEEEEIRFEVQKPVFETGEPFIEQPVEEINAPEPVELSFTGWLNKISGNSKANRVEAVKNVVKTSSVAAVVTEEKKVENQPAHGEFDEETALELARKSIEPDDKLVTETYARILYMQGKYDKAIEVYQVLSLKKPAKSDYFAALIEQIKKKK